MNIRAVPFNLITADELATWDSIQRDEPAFASPYFRPEFTQAVANVRRGVEVAVLEEHGQPVGFFPFERSRWNHGKPVGSRLSDFQGVIARGHVEYDPLDLVRSCDLSCWHFDHLVNSNLSFDKFAFRYADSPRIDLSRGFAAYEESFHTHFRRGLRRRLKLLKRDIGPVRLVYNTRDPQVLSTLFNWKVAQYQRTKVPNVLGFPWVRDLLGQLLEFRGPEFEVVLAALYAGDNLLAASYLMKSGTVLHSWFSAYDREMQLYSPGIRLKVELLREASERGIQFMDLGKGPEEYKRDLQNSALPVSEGIVDTASLRMGVRSAWWSMRRSVQASRFHKLAHGPAHVLYMLQCWLDLI